MEINEIMTIAGALEEAEWMQHVKRAMDAQDVKFKAWREQFDGCDKRCHETPGTVESPKGEIPCPYASSTCWAEEGKPHRKEASYQEFLRHLGVPIIFLTVSFAGSKPNDLIAAAKKYAQRGIAAGKALILGGLAGTGKTHAAICVLREFLDGWGQAINFSPLSSLANKIKYSTNEERMDLLHRLKKADLLILDDLESKGRGDAVHGIIEEVVYYRHGNNKPTVITTKVDKGEWEKEFGATIADRLRGNWGVGAASSDSSRRGKVKEEAEQTVAW